MSENGATTVNAAVQSSAEPLSAAPATSPNGIEHTLANGRVAVHDPAIVEENGVYYLFGTHRRCARSTDMVHWERFDNNLSRDPYALLGDIWQAWPKQDSNPDLLGNTWAPDVIWNETMGKWCMYLSVNGDQFRSVIVLLTADHVDGDWTYVGPVVYSGFDESNLWNTDVPKVLELEPKTDGTVGYDLTRYLSLKDTRINAIDAAPALCEHGEMWMSFGSWFGGIWMFKLDPKTGLRDYSVRYPLVKDSSDPYYGVKWPEATGIPAKDRTSFVKTDGGICSCRTAGLGAPADIRFVCSVQNRCLARTWTRTAIPRFRTVRFPTIRSAAPAFD